MALKLIFTKRKIYIACIFIALIFFGNFMFFNKVTNADVNLQQFANNFNFEVENSTKEFNTTTNKSKLSTTVNYLDKRAYVFDMYFKQNNSPLYGYGKTFVEACDFYKAPKDCIILVAIAENETDLCKYHNSAEMHNCWGFGGGGTYRWNFNSFEESIFKVTDVLVNQYGKEYIIDPRKMERTFCGSDAGCENWGSKILYFINKIDKYSESIGYGRLTEYR